MIRRHILAFAATAGALGLAHAQTAAPTTYPAKPIRMVVPFPPGGGTDILARLVSSRLSEVNKWTVVADNKPGAGGTIGIGEAVKAAPTGYDIVMGQKDNLVIGPWPMLSTAPSRCMKYRNLLGTESTHWRTGRRGNT